MNLVWREKSGDRVNETANQHVPQAMVIAATTAESVSTNMPSIN
jgi:hypothetical protein